ncbi:response regulator [Chitinophaga lutea]
MAVRVVIYEDNDQLRESLRNLLSLTEGFEVPGAFAETGDVVRQVAVLMPDVILMDINMPGGDGISAVKKIRAVNRTVQIMMLTVFEEASHVFNAIYAGANGYLLKKQASEKLIQAIREVMAGGAPMSPTVARLVISSIQRPPDGATEDYQLTPREKEILQSLSQGNSFKLIGAELGISIDTVRTHIKRIYDKLHVRSQIEAVSKAINEKLV